MDKANPTFSIRTFGCQMNERDSEIMAQLLAENGYVESIGIEEADVVILNTCSIRAKAEQKAMSLLGSLRKLKKRRPGMKICVAGCVAQQEGQELCERMPHVDLVIGTQNIYNLANLLSSCSKGSCVATVLTDRYQIPAFIPSLQNDTVTTRPFKKFITIMQGCNNYCTYCVVPYTRGREISRLVSDILNEARALVESGIKEITLLGQNVNSYGRTNSVEHSGDYSFAQLLHEVAAISGLERLRFTTSNPKDLSSDLMRCFAEIDILCPQFHLPVQSGSNTILERMNRKYTREQYLEKVTELRSYRPDIALSTDVIVGFPGETDSDFEQTMDILESVRYHSSFSFKYSDRPGTRSINFIDKIDEDVKSARLNRFQTRQDEICLEQNSLFVGKTFPVMIEKNDTSGLVGRTMSNHLVHIQTDSPALPGDTLTVLIERAGQHSLGGRSV